MSTSEQKKEIIDIVDTAARMKINHLFFQVRPEGDALYASDIEPWSRFLTGRQGASPAYDPLAFMIAEAKKHNIKVHAWINPFRAASDYKIRRSGKHAAGRLSHVTYRIDSKLWFDPGSPEVQDHIIAVVGDILRRYDVAGIHYDDYFYPYPKPGQKSVYFPDEKTFAAYRAKGGTLNRPDWRRQNINKLIERTDALVKSSKPGAIFGVSPFGIYTPGQPSTVRGELDQLNSIYADPKKWLKEGWVDYLAPQLYWAEDSPQRFSELVKWWRSKSTNPRGIPIYPGIAIDRMNPPHNWSPFEIVKQIKITRQYQGEPNNGFILWNIGPILKNRKNVNNLLKERCFNEAPAAAPAPTPKSNP